VGFPYCEFPFKPIHTSLPFSSTLVSVWFTITVPKAANGHGESSSLSAEIARRIQYALVSYETVEVEEWMCFWSWPWPLVKWIKARRIRLRIESGFSILVSFNEHPFTAVGGTERAREFLMRTAILALPTSSIAHIN
jgi:hypothetical protein